MLDCQFLWYDYCIYITISHIPWYRNIFCTTYHQLLFPTPPITTSTFTVAVPLANSTHPLYCNTSTGTQCPLLPLSWWCTVWFSSWTPSPWYPSNSKQPNSYGLISTQMFVVGLASAYGVNMPKFEDTLLPHSQLFQSLTLVLISSTSDNFRHGDSLTMLTIIPDGLKQSLSLWSCGSNLPQWLDFSLWCPSLIAVANLSLACGPI